MYRLAISLLCIPVPTPIDACLSSCRLTEFIKTCFCLVAFLSITDGRRGEGGGSGRKKNPHLKCLLHLLKVTSKTLKVSKDDCVVQPIVIFRDGGVPQGHRGFLQPRLRDQAPSKVSFQSTIDIANISSQSQACVWYDWFLSDSDPDPTVVAHFEELFLEVRRHSTMFQKIALPPFD